MVGNLAKWTIGIVLLVALVVVSPLVLNRLVGKQLQVPPVDPVEVVWLDQNWSSEDWAWWYHGTQGSAFESPIPYDWFLALEQPTVKLVGEADLFREDSYLQGFGFLPDRESPVNPDGLPVGFAKADNYFNWQTGEPVGSVVGFTCAACHTGQINYQGTGIRIEGGPAMTELNIFKNAVALALGLTASGEGPTLLKVLRTVDGLLPLGPSRFDRFADRVLGPDSPPEARADLKDQLNQLVENAIALGEITEDYYPSKPEEGEEGFARLDALDRIGNFVFGTEIVSQNPEIEPEENYQFADAPVNYPHIWTTSWFNWVQYNGSVMQPMTRNAGEAMGVFARVNFDPNDAEHVFRSNVDVRGLYELENILAGSTVCNALDAPNCPERLQQVIDSDNPYEYGLKAPQWPKEILGAIDQEKAARGEELYQQHCQQCHLPSTHTEAIWDEDYWETLGELVDRQYLRITMKNLYEIGTDPQAALNWYKRTVNLGQLVRNYPSVQPELSGLEPYQTGGYVSAGFALPYVVEKTVEAAYEQEGILSEADQDRFNGYRPERARAPLAYKARPLNGIWATPPYLHNGAVPNLYEMFLPAEQRSSQFYLGTKEFDPKTVGYRTDEIPGGFLLDTQFTGNSNQGHEFKGDGTGRGVVGPELPEADRWALVEYLKTL